jgi:ubiquitin-like modifier-activating enzyme ATG7
MNSLRFVSAKTITDTGFWQTLASLKKDELKLNEDPIDIYPTSSFSNPSKENVVVPPVVNLDSFSFDSKHLYQSQFTFKSTGTIVNYNTMQSFKECDKKALIDAVAETIKNKIKEKDTTALRSVLLISFADLKAFKFYYVCAHVTLSPKSPFLVDGPVNSVDEKVQMNICIDIDK